MTEKKRKAKPATRDERQPRTWTTALLAGAAFAVIAVAEARRPLRTRRESWPRRLGRNLATAGLSALVTTVLQTRFLVPLANRIERERLGILHRVPLPPPLRTLAAVLLLDYTLWWWHYANHRVSLFWRFHLVHHVDRDLDASTGIRFHFGEMALSVAFRMAQLRLLGIPRQALTIWQTLLLISIAFHHSNLRLPEDLERVLVPWIVTPRMHGIHHSDYRDEADSNWSSLLSVWDRLHGTLRLDVPQDVIEIGVPAYQREEDVTLLAVTALPFVAQRHDWTGVDGSKRTSRPTGE